MLLPCPVAPWPITIWLVPATALGSVWSPINTLLLPVVIGIGIAVAVAFYPITLAIIGLIALGAAFDYLTKKVPINVFCP